MIDFHCHLDLYPSAKEVVRECMQKDMYVLSVTTTPSAWNGTAALSAESKKIRTAIGLHPQLAAERRHELPIFDEVLLKTDYVGEVGLDGGNELKSTWDDQRAVFSHILRRCTEAKGKILTIHSRRATSAVLDELERWPNCGTPVLHWFSGTFSELERAKRIGCWFSVGPTMLASKKGRDIVARLPPERVLTETDGPFAQMHGQVLHPWNVSMALEPLSEAWEIPELEVSQALDNNLRTLTSSHSK